ncbi:MAG: hypothetical protein ACI9FJ_002080, partial [Alteromonadaceae bacterium]
QEIQIIETLAGDHMSRHGYDRITTGSVEISDEMIATARQQSAIKQQQAWDDLKQNAPQDYLLRQRRAEFLAMVKQRMTVVNK